MSLAAESPMHSSSSSDDFAALLDAELERGSSDAYSDDDPDNEEEEDVLEQSSKRRKVEDVQVMEKVEGPTEFENTPDNAEASSKPLLEKVCPPHPGFIKGMCMRCGQFEDDESGVALSYIHKDLRLASTEINKLRGSNLENLLGTKKLILILDLDHTLLNSARLEDISPGEEYLKHQVDSKQGDPGRSIFKFEHMRLMTKLRPFVHTFLKEASSMFEMYVYTMGERPYALEMANILDPDKVYFDTRVISQADSTKRHQKGLDVVLGAENVIVILDDTEIVWQRHRENLILMERYHYFASSCRQFGFTTRSLSELKKDEREADGALAIILDVLKRAHRMFFDEVPKADLASRDVRQVLNIIRQEILQGCKIVFSRVFPSEAHAEDQSIWKLARQLGALCCTEVNPSVTHVVSTDKGTKKARWALQNRKFLVNPHWIEAARYLWSRQREEDFQINDNNAKEPSS